MLKFKRTEHELEKKKERKKERKKKENDNYWDGLTLARDGDR